MKLRLLGMIVLGLCGVSVAGAQTLYVAPGESSGSSTVQPLNLRELMRREQEARNQSQRQSPVPYVTAPGAAPGASFAQRKAALDQWRTQRDRQAWADQRQTRAEMIAMAESPTLLPSGADIAPSPPGSAQQTTPAQPARPMIFRGAQDDAPIQSPRRLFNTPD